MMSIQPLFDKPLPEGWQILKVDDIKGPHKHSCVAGPFGSNISSKYFVEIGVPVIRGNNLRDDLTRFVPTGFAFVSEERAQKYKAQHVRPGDLVFTCWGTLGQVGLIPDDGPYPEYIISNKQLKLSPDRSRCDPLYLFYYFSSQQMVEYIRRIASSSAVPGINLALLKSFLIALPPRDIQERIVSILAAYDDLIENNTRRIAILEEMARALYQEWFVHFRFPGHEHVPRVDSPLGPIPEGWQALPLRDVCERITDGAHHSPKSIEGNGGKHMASVKDMHDWGLSLETCRRISDADFRDLERNNCRPRKGDILIAKDGAKLNKHTFLMVDEADVVLLSSIAVITPGKGVAPEFLCEQLKYPDVSERIKGSVSGAAIPRIILKDFARLVITLPPLSVQTHWERLASPLLNLCRNLVRKNRTLRITRDLLLPKLISGELDISQLPERPIAEAAD